MKKFIFTLFILLSSVVQTQAEIQEIEFKIAGGDDGILISKKDERDLFDVCMEKICLVKEFSEEYDEDRDGDNLFIDLSYSIRGFDKNDLEILKTNIVSKLAAYAGQDDKVIKTNLKNDFQVYTNDCLVKLFWLVDFLQIPVYQEALEEFVCENSARLEAIFDDVPGAIQKSGLQENLVRCFVKNNINNFGQLTRDDLKERVLKRVEVYAYEHCQQADFGDWMNIVQQKAAVLGKAMEGVKKRAQEILGENNNNLRENAEEVREEFNALPEGILKMMLRFMSENTLRDSVAVTPIWQRVEAMFDKIWNVKNILKKSPRLLWCQMKIIFGKETLSENVSKVLSGELDLTLIRGNLSAGDFNNILLAVTTLYGPYIKHLSLGFNQLTQVPDFSNLTNLQELDLGNNELTQVPDFSNLTKLQKLNLAYNKLTDVPDFSHLPNLKVLRLFYNRLTQVPDFSNLSNLKALNLWGNQLTQVPDFSNLPNLQELDLAYNKLTDVPDFSNLPKLQKLDLDSNQLTQISDFSGLPKLQKLNLGFNKLTQVSDFSNLTNLENLNLRFNRLTQVSDFSGLPKLQKLNLGLNELTQVPDFSELKSLKELDLDGNELTQVPDFSNLTNLENLNLRNNELTQVPDFNNLLNLQELHLEWNPIVQNENWLQRKQELLEAHPDLEVTD